MKSFIERYASFVIRYRWLVVILTLVASVFLATSVTRLGLNTDLRIFFNPDNPELLNFEALERTYAKNDNVFIALSTKDESIFSKETLTAIQQLTHDSWQVPYSSRVSSITNFQHSYAKDDEIIVENFSDKYWYMHITLAWILNGS